MTQEKLDRLAALEKLTLTDDERDFITTAAATLEESFAALATVDTEGVAPLVSVLAVENVLREDVAAKTLTRIEILANAPAQLDGYFQVPPTL